MLKQLLLLVAVFSCLQTNAQTPDSSHLRVSLLTCGTGPETWETFGHTAIRIVDSARGTDMAYNYGTFSFGDDFALQFMRGKLLYYLSYYPYQNFIQEYREVGRSVEEQELLLSGDKKKELQDFLHMNAEEENRYYKYDFFFDNCATRIRDVFPKSLGKGFVFGKTPAATNRITFREIINQYYAPKHWERLGVNVLLGSRIDKVMTNEDMMFLPDYLRDGIAKATLNGKSIAGAVTPILPNKVDMSIGLNEPFVLMCIICLLTIVGLTVKPLKALGKFMTFLLLFVTGLLGVLIIVMWLGTDHQGCQNNFNILWLLPTNLMMAFARKRNKGRYAIIGIVLIIVSLLLHLLKVQGMLLLEYSPLWLALMLVFGTIYRRDRANSHGQA
ncbi:MAG: DUF4105 domain-containing protein [Sphingobacteriales bacterium]|nr:MAG: DUF4105 domain-containing protein [Sphingobacteriales bacterium]